MTMSKRVWLVFSTAALLLACFAVNQAQAGTYIMRSCNVPGAPSTSVGPWTWADTSAEIYANDECANGGGFGLNAGTISVGNNASVHLGITREGPLAAVTIRRFRLWMIARLGGSGGPMIVSYSAGSTSHVMRDDLFASPGGSTLTVPFVSPELFPDTHILYVHLLCATAPCAPSSSYPLEIRGAEVTLHEAAPPTAAVDGGPLLDGHPQSGVRGLSFTASDGQSGVAEVSALLGSTVVAAQDFRRECAYAGLAACPVSREGSLLVDTRTIDDGTYPLSIRVTDAAGNSQTIPSATITIANGGSLGRPSNGTSATEDVRLSASFVGRRGSRATLRYHQKATIRGRLTSASGVPIGQAEVEVVETPIGLPNRTKTRMTTTATDGRFRYTVRSRGMSRNVNVRYHPVVDGEKVAAARLLSVRVAAAGTLHVTLRGVRVSYNGRILSAPVPRRGLRLYVEGRAVGGQWTRFAVRHTTSSGRFSGRYRLRVRRPGVRLQFRIRIPRQAGYPYATGVGRPVTRTVR